MAQVLSAQNEIPHEIEDLYDEYCRRSMTPDVTVLKRHLIFLFSRLSSSFVLFDALDVVAAENVPDMMALITEISKTGVKVFCTSNTTNIKSQLGEPEALEIRADDDDIVNYLNLRLNKEWEYDDEFKQEILDHIVEKASGKSPPQKKYLTLVSYLPSFNWTTY